MKTTFGSSKHLAYYMARLSIFLTAIALVAGMMGCPPPEYTLTISSTVGGEVSVPGEGPYTYLGGTVVNLTATAYTDYTFMNWTGDVGTIADVNSASTTITVNDNCSITANFFHGEVIRNWHDLNNIRNNPGGSYILMNDLNSTTPGYEELASPTANNGTGWQPIGVFDFFDPARAFKGTFHGQGYKIEALFVNRPDELRVGLFGMVGEGGLIEDVGVLTASVTGKVYVGGLVGYNEGDVKTCHATGTVSGASYVGGLVGFNHGNVESCYSAGSVSGVTIAGGLVGSSGGTLSNSHSASNIIGHSIVGGLVGEQGGTVDTCHATGSVTGEDTVGGLVGDNDGGTVSNSYATGSVTGEDAVVGGLVGYNDIYGTVSNSYATGSVTGGDTVGGLVGYSHNGTVSNSYATGSVTGDDVVGGLMGVNGFGNLISNCYATGSVTRSSGEGTSLAGFVGENQAAITNCYSTGSVHYENAPDPTDKGFAGAVAGGYEMSGNFWDTQASEQSSTAGDATGKTTAEMMDITTFLGAGWIIIAVPSGSTVTTHTWNIVDGQTYPFLSWQPI